MAWTRISQETLDRATNKATELRLAIQTVANETGNHQELHRMNELEADAKDIQDALSKISDIKGLYESGMQS